MLLDITYDWTHFLHLHRKSHGEFRLLHKSEKREIFFYKARIIYPLPFFRKFLVFREYQPEVGGYRQVYYDLSTGGITYLSAFTRHNKDRDSYSCMGEYIFSVSWYWKLWPRLFSIIMKQRMGRVIEEDNELVRGRAEVGGKERLACAPKQVTTFDLLDDFLQAGLPKTEAHFYQHFFSDLLVGQPLS